MSSRQISMAMSAGLPAPARPPVSAMLKPILIGSWARANLSPNGAVAVIAAPAAVASSTCRRVASRIVPIDLRAVVLVICLPPGFSCATGPRPRLSLRRTRGYDHATHRRIQELQRRKVGKPDTQELTDCCPVEMPGPNGFDLTRAGLRMAGGPL